MAMLLKQSGWKKIVAIFLVIGLILGLSNFLSFETVSAAENSVTIKVDGEAIHTFTWEELQDMRSDEEAWVEARPYSTINTWPTKKWYVSEGVKLTALFEAAGVALDDEGIQAIKVESVDGFKASFTKKQLFDDARYYFPGLKDNHEFFGQVPGSTGEKEIVDVIIALKSVEGSNDPDHMNPLNCPLLVIGQHYVTEQTNHTFVKNVGEIDLLTESPGKWATPTATVAPGTVPAGTKVELENEFNDDDKIYYTTDGTDPTSESLIYNWVASRWWAGRWDELDEINKPIEIIADTTIKAKTIGLGREDSDIVTFEYEVETVAVTGVSISEGDQTLEEGKTIQLNAVVEPEDATNKGITWSTGDATVATVDEESGLVTAVSEGETIITVTTEDGDFTDSLTVTVVPAESEPGPFKVEDGVLTEYTGSGGDLIIPDNLNITSIGRKVFMGLDTLTSVIIPEGVTSFGLQAFSNCTGLTTVTIPDSVEEMGGWGFCGCSKLTSVNIPSSVEVIETAVFMDCVSLTSISIPEGVEIIEDNVFNGCSSLSSVIMPKSLTKIGSGAFEDCESLISVTVPENVVEIGAFAFEDCSGLTEVVLSDSVETIGGSIFTGCGSLTTVTLSKKLTSIPSWAFMNCTSLAEITIPEGVTEILDSFHNCSSLTKIIIPETVNLITSTTFSGCNQLTIYGYKGSYAETFAAARGIPFVELTKPPLYNIAPVEDDVYIIGETGDGIRTMTAKPDQTGFKYFTVAIEPIEPHEGTETLIFTHIREGVQSQLNALEADFDEVSAAKAGFNIEPGDIIKVYIVDELTNDSNRNPIMLQ